MRHALAAGVAAVLLVLAGCSTPGTAHPNPNNDTKTPTNNTSRPQPTSSDLPPNVPRVTNPINTTRFEQNPCRVITPAQRNKLSIKTKPKPKMSESGPGCEWGDVFDDGITIEGAFLTKGRGSSIAGLYKNNKLGRYDYFQPIEIHGYPAAFSAPFDGRDRGGCAIAVGVRNDLLYSIGIDLGTENPNYGNPCSVLKRVAEMAVKTMTQGGS